LPCSLTLLVWGATAAPAIAQPPAPPKVWTVAVSAGLALASGNTDTTIQKNDDAVLMAFVYKS
jgi:hypothetical protein